MAATVRNTRKTVVEEIAWKTDVSAAKKQISTRGKSWFRWLNKGFRQAVQTLETICTDKPPTDQAGRVALLETLIAGQKSLRAIEADEGGNGIGRRAFGTSWKESFPYARRASLP